MEGEDKEFTQLRERINKTLEERYPNWKEPIEELKAMDQYLITCAGHDYPSEGAKEEEKDMLDPKIYKGICNKLSKINIYVKEEVIPEIIKVFKTLLRIFNSEISSGRCHPEIMEASEVLFKVNESFFKSHRVEAPEKKTKESEKEKEEKEKKEQKDTKDDTDKKEDIENTGETEDVHNWGAPDDSPEKTNNNEDLSGLYPYDPEMAAAVNDGAKKDLEGMAAEDTRAGEKTETPDGDGDTEELDKTGNQADDECEDQSKYFEDGAYNNADTTFTPDKEYDYEYDENLFCMVYTGPEFELGELVDALKTEQEVTTQTLTCWEQAKVVENNSNYYVIQFIRDYPNFKTIQKDVFRTMMFKYETHTRHNKWRYFSPDKQLNLMVEVYHEDRWQLAKIMSTCESINGEVDLVNLQTFPDPDNTLDMDKSDFPQYPIRSPRIRLTTSGLRYLGPTSDFETMAGTETYPRNVGTYGGNSSTNNDGKTSIHVLLCQEFVRIGTHQAIVERISNKENPLPIDQVVAFLNILVVIIVYIREHTDYDSELQSFNQVVLASLEDYVENDLLLPSIKEFKHEYFKSINQAIVKFRLGNEFNQRMVTLIIECAKRCLNSAYLSVRVQGCKEIESRCSTAHRSNTSHLSKDELAEWLSKNQIIKSIFGANHHSELIRRSEYMLKILSRSKIGISEEEIKLIWNLTKRDKQTKKEIYTILGKVGDLLNDEVKEFIFDRLKEYDNFLIDDINFLYSFKKNTDFQLECTWKILNNSFSYEQEVVQSAFAKLEDMMKFSSMEKKLDYVNKSIAKLASGDMSLVLIRILKATLKNINLATARVQNMGDQFETAKDELLLKFYENFNNYCETVEEICIKDDRRRFNAAYECFVDTFNHEEHLKEKLEFISELYKLYKITITKEHMDLLWKCLSMTRIRLNIEMYFKWLNSQIEAYNSKKSSFLTDEIIEYFFTERILNEQNNYSLMETEGFTMFKSLFKLVNEKYHKLQILNTTRGKVSQHTITTNGATITSTSYGKLNQKKEFIIYVHPDQLLGINIVWRIMMECNNIAVTAD